MEGIIVSKEELSDAARKGLEALGITMITVKHPDELKLPLLK